LPGKWEKMLDEYYSTHHWDIKTGWQTKECLVELGLHDVKSRIEKVNKFPPGEKIKEKVANK